MAEEYLGGFGPAMSRLFDVSWTEQSFVLVFTCVGPALYSLTALGLYYRVPLAGFVAWFIFIGPGLAELTHFVFPVLEPAILSQLSAWSRRPFRTATSSPTCPTTGCTRPATTTFQASTPPCCR